MVEGAQHQADVNVQEACIVGTFAKHVGFNLSITVQDCVLFYVHSCVPACLSEWW
jgi:hypothetical protein